MLKLENKTAVNTESIELQIEKLMLYGLQKELIGEDDYFVVRNALFDLFGVISPTSDRIQKRFNEIELSSVLDGIVDAGVNIGISGSSAYERDMFGTKVMGFLTPRGSEVSKTFAGLMEKSPEAATDYYFALSKNTGYIKEGNSVRWFSETAFGELELTINKAKPEKDPKKIAEEKNKSLYGVYPKCLLCPQSAGYKGSERYPARDNHRIIPLKKLGGPNRNWYLQYSPYQYYNEHCIVLYQNHVPMKIDEKTFETLFDFIELFPHYFIGSNADLPIVGGSILSHEHYQGGRHRFPIEKASVEKSFRNGDFEGVTADIMRWPLSTIRLRCSDRAALTRAALHIMNFWRNYSDSVILPFTKEETDVDEIPHNTVTPILRRADNGAGYELDIVLRNNLTSEEHPLGIYHPHKDVWHIKKENIGLIEVMGLAVLPPRLLAETAKIMRILEGGEGIREAEGAAWSVGRDSFFEENKDILQHREWIDYLIEKYGTKNTDSEARGIIQKEIGFKFARVLSDCGVFKPDAKGLERFYTFMRENGWE